MSTKIRKNFDLSKADVAVLEEIKELFKASTESEALRRGLRLALAVKKDMRTKNLFLKDKITGKEEEIVYLP